MITIQELLIFAYVFVTTWLLHEFGHGLNNYLQTGKIGKIGINIKRLTMWHEPDGEIKNYPMYYLMGGITASLITFAVLILSGRTPFTFALITCGWMQLIYGAYEGFTPKNEQLVRYGIYAGVFLFWLVVWVI